MAEGNFLLSSAIFWRNIRSVSQIGFARCLAIRNGLHKKGVMVMIDVN